MSRNFSKIKISDYARLSINPLRKITQEQKIDPNPAKKPITLQLGDPTIFGRKRAKINEKLIKNFILSCFYFYFKETSHHLLLSSMLSIMLFYMTNFRTI